MGMGLGISVLGVDLGKNVCSLRFRAPKRKETPCRPISLWAISPIVGVAANWQGKVVDLSIKFLDTGDGLPAALMGHQDRIALGPQPIGPERPPALEN